jgi:hypothetical protein
MSILEGLQKRCSNKEFLECLVLEIKRHGSKMQRVLSRHKRIKVEALNKKLENLKIDYTANGNEILKVEKVLQVFLDTDLRERMLEYKIFECLNAEKATPLLVSLAKKSGKGDSLDNIKNNDGVVFDNSEERQEFIREYFANLYKRDDFVHGSIKEFLGPDICNHPTVRLSKLTAQERQDLDNPLAIIELDKALNNANMRSAWGIDGYSYRFIREF